MKLFRLLIAGLILCLGMSVNAYTENSKSDKIRILINLLTIKQKIRFLLTNLDTRLRVFH